MTFTLNDMVNSVAGVLKERWPDVKVYNNPKQGGATLPCFLCFSCQLKCMMKWTDAPGGRLELMWCIW